MKGDTESVSDRFSKVRKLTLLRRNIGIVILPLSPFTNDVKRWNSFENISYCVVHGLKIIWYLRSQKGIWPGRLEDGYELLNFDCWATWVCLGFLYFQVLLIDKEFSDRLLLLWVRRKVCTSYLFHLQPFENSLRIKKRFYEPREWNQFANISLFKNSNKSFHSV